MALRLSKEERVELKGMFGGRCAYCGTELGEKWHADHVKPVKRDGRFVHGKWETNGVLRRPENDHKENFYPSCVKCNILKAADSVESFRASLAYFARSIPTIRTYSHVHHLMRFNRLTISAEPVVFWFEQYKKEDQQDVHHS